VLVGRISPVAVTHTFAGLPVSDFAAEYAWYVALFGREADMFPREGEAVWQLTSTASVYVVADLERAGDGLLTLALADLDSHVSRLRKSGLRPAELRSNEEVR
jgi:hypothetical protein